VPPCTGFTIGILPLWPLGLPAETRLIHRLPLFLALADASEGEPLRPEHLARVIARGLFRAARGERILFFNQVEDPEGFARAEEVTALLPESFRYSLRAILAGSVKQDRVKVVGRGK
jgi:probable selenium-dependent hydroxylase accessory protein YqeC